MGVSQKKPALLIAAVLGAGGTAPLSLYKNILTGRRTTMLMPTGPRPCYNSAEAVSLSGSCGTASWCTRWYCSFLSETSPFDCVDKL